MTPQLKGRAATVTRGVAMTLALLALAACAVEQTPDATLQEVQAVAYRDPGPTKLTLYTMVNNSSGSGAHSSLMISGSQRVVFDPAGSVRLSSIPERGDVLFGITDQVADFYMRAHARRTYHVIVQEVTVPPAVAEMALRKALNYGSVGQARCTIATSNVLSSLPGFESIKQTWFPVALSKQLEAMPGVTTRRVYEDDDDDKAVAIAAFTNG